MTEIVVFLCLKAIQSAAYAKGWESAAKTRRIRPPACSDGDRLPFLTGTFQEEDPGRGEFESATHPDL
ncbi:MAG: hypothetical protein JRM77_09830 [Nitrososphaerota archaeon]|nr:hypothetical protein [Nitrososphaerota archaeon]